MTETAVIRCTKDEGLHTPKGELVYAGGSYAEVKGTVEIDSHASVVERGFIWTNNQYSQEEFYMSKAESISAGEGSGDFTAIISGLESETTYWIRAYVKGADSIRYGDIFEFTTKKSGSGDDFTEDDYEWE